MILAAHRNGSGVNRALGVLCLDLLLKRAADAGERAARVEGVQAVAGEAEYVGTRFNVAEDLVARVPLAQHAEAEGVGFVGIGLSVGVAQLAQKRLILLCAPHRQGDAFSVARSCAGDHHTAEHGEGEEEGDEFYEKFHEIHTFQGFCPLMAGQVEHALCTW